jgi:hypothetical protein
LLGGVFGVDFVKGFQAEIVLAGCGLCGAEAS